MPADFAFVFKLQFSKVDHFCLFLVVKGVAALPWALHCPHRYPVADVDNARDTDVDNVPQLSLGAGKHCGNSAVCTGGGGAGRRGWLL